MDTTEETVLERDERLQRVIIKQKEFRVKKVCMDILEDVLEMVRQYRAAEMVSAWLVKVTDQAVEDPMINRMLGRQRSTARIPGTG